MKIAIYEPYPRICGVTAWTFHVAQGFRDLGHDCDVVSFTKSGRARKTTTTRKSGEGFSMGWHWWPEKPDVVTKFVNASDVLNTYDLIVLNEPKNGTVDREAKKREVEAEYIDVLRKTTTPWMTILHAPQYDPQRTPFLESTMDAGNFSGFAIEHQPGSYDSGASVFAGRIRKIQQWPWLPYRIRDVDPDVERYRAIGIAGRTIPNKGYTALAYLADRYPDGWQTWLYGGEAGGNGAAFSFTLYEAMSRRHGWRGYRLGPSENPIDDIGNSGGTLYQWPWWLEKNDHILKFFATYDDPVKMWQSIGVATNLTSINFAVGLEYTMLEAMNARCALVMPSHCFQRTGREQYSAYTLNKYTVPPGISGKTGVRTDAFDGGVDDELVETITEACDAFTNDAHGADLNMAALKNYHAPRHLAKTILESV